MTESLKALSLAHATAMVEYYRNMEAGDDKAARTAYNTLCDATNAMADEARKVAASLS